MWDGLFESDIEFFNLHPTKGTHWDVYLNQNYFDSYGCSPPQKLSKFIISRNGHCLFSEYKIQGLTNERDYCAAFCLDIIYLTKVLGLDFEICCFQVYTTRWYNNVDVFFKINDVTENNYWW